VARAIPSNVIETGTLYNITTDNFDVYLGPDYHKANYPCKLALYNTNQHTTYTKLKHAQLADMLKYFSTKQ
jgi:hypothetical protein